MPLIMHGDQEFNLSHEEEEKLNQFQAITNFPDDELPLIIQLFQNYGWHLERALSSYFDNDWKSSLLANEEQPPIPERPATPTPSPRIQRGQDSSPFLISDLNLVPSLPFVKPLPSNYRETYSVVGLNKSKGDIWGGNQGSSPLLMVLMFIPRVLGRLGVGIISILWGIITFGFRSTVNEKARVCKIPTTPNVKSIPISEALGQVADEKSLSRLQKIVVNQRTFNESLKICDEEFKFLLVVLIGNVYANESEEYDKNSSLLVSKILSSDTVLSYLKSHEDDIMIYIGSVNELEPWLIAKQMNIKYTPECLLIGNVLNSNGSVNGVTRLSILSKLRMSSSKRFYNSLKLTVERFNPELLVSRTEKAELRMAREIRKRQDDAYEESLRNERLKEETRQLQIEEQLKNQSMQEEIEKNRKWKETAKKLFWVDSCIRSLYEEPIKDQPIEDTATLQVRTSQGLRLIKKFKSSTTLYSLYVAIGCHLFLKEIKQDPTQWKTKIINEIELLSQDASNFCFKSLETLSDGVAIQEIADLIKKEIDNLPKQYAEFSEIGFDFELITPFPRDKIPKDKKIAIRDVQQLWPKGSLLVEDIIEDDSDESEGSGGSEDYHDGK